MTPFQTTIKQHVQAAFAGIWIQSHEPDEVEREICSLAAQQEDKWAVLSWDGARGLYDPSNRDAVANGSKDPAAALKAPDEERAKTNILLLHNYHRYLVQPAIMQDCGNRIREGKAASRFTIVVSPVVQVPIELEKIFTVIEHTLPNQEDLDRMAQTMASDHGIQVKARAVQAAKGLTRYEAENAFALSVILKDEIEPETIWEQKAQMLKKASGLSLHRSQSGFDSIGGLDNLKQFCRMSLCGEKKQRPRGIMLFGVPGTGKSAFAQSLGKETHRPTICMDVGSMFNKHVGDTENNIRKSLSVADAMEPCILFVDEIEKALSGVGSSGDSGVATRMFGAILTWLSDHTSEVFFIATCNSIATLPPEFARAERFDALFFIDLPNKAERDLIWKMYKDVYQVNGNLPNDDGWTGAEIRSCCRLASMLGVALQDAAQYVVPVSVTNSDKIQATREWADGRCISASSQGIYRSVKERPATNQRRQLTRA